MDFDQYIQPIIDFVRLHQAWAAPIVAALCFAESLAFISLLIPAWGVLVGLGALISASGLDFWPILIAGALGAACGDWLSYWVGLKLENRVYHMWPLSQHPYLIPAGEAFIKKWGTAAIVIARFSGRCAPRCRSSLACSPCRTGRFRSPTSARRCSGAGCC